MRIRQSGVNGTVFHSGLVLGAAAIVALLVLNAGLEYWNTRQLRENDASVAHTAEVLDSLEGIVSTVKDAETGQRGYLITGKDPYLIPYHAAVAAIQDRIQRLKLLTQDNPRHEARILPLQDQVSAKLKELDRTIALRKKDPQAAQQIVLTDEGQKLMDAIRGQVREMEQEERGLLVAREQQSRQSYLVAVVTMLVTLAVGLGMVGAIFHLLQRYLWERQKIDDERLRSAEEILRQKELLAVTLASIGDGVIVTDTSSAVTFLNGEAERLTGWTNGEAEGHPLPDVFRIINEQTREPVENPVEKVLREGAVVGLANHTLLVAKDGREIPIDDSGSPIRQSGGAAQGTVLVFRDVTQQKQAERSAARLAAIVESSNDAILSKDLDGVIQTWNAGAERLFGYRAEEVVGKPITLLLPPERVQEEAQILARVRAGKLAEQMETVRVTKDGRPIHVSVTVSPVKDRDGQIIGASKIVRDITDRKRTEETLREQAVLLNLAREELELRVQKRTADLVRTNVELDRARQAAEAASRAKSTFLANMSHEIRTPLNGVIGMTELVLKSTLTAQQREFLMAVKDSGEALLSVINDILDFSKIEAGKLALVSATFDLRESLGDTMKSFALRAHERGLELTCFIHPEVPRMVVGDYNRLRQVMVNLVGNAVKFTDKGEIGLEVTQESRSQEDVVLHLTVSDTGIGIPTEKREKIFEMFEQADSSPTRRHGGTGLGLAIASRLVGLMDGQIWVDSEVGRGSRFHFTIRLRLAEEEPVEAAAPEPACLHEMRVMVVDDNATNRRILEETLRSWRMIPSSAASAVEAMDLLRQAREAGEPCQLVVTDAHMPLIDGFTLAEQIKQDPVIGSTVIMMLTSGDRPDDTARCDELGISAYMLKPVKQSELLEAIEMALGITVLKEELLKPASQQSHHVSSLHVLLAEDSLVNQKLAVALLEGQGHTVTLARNGREAVAATAVQNFDLALMDVQMPEMDGLEATEQIRAREQRTGTHLPIIAMTAHALKGDRERCLQAGMDSYVAKPIRAEELLQTIDAIFSDRKPQAVNGSAASRDVVNWTEALETAQGNPQLLKSMTEAALEEIPQLRTAIRQAITDGDPTRLRHAAHTLKGSVRYFGAKQVCDHAAKLEDMASSGKLAGAETIVTALEGETAEVAAQLSDYLRGN